MTQSVFSDLKYIIKSIKANNPPNRPEASNIYSDCDNVVRKKTKMINQKIKFKMSIKLKYLKNFIF